MSLETCLFLYFPGIPHWWRRYSRQVRQIGRTMLSAFLYDWTRGPLPLPRASHHRKNTLLQTPELRVDSIVFPYSCLYRIKIVTKYLDPNGKRVKPKVLGFFLFSLLTSWRSVSTQYTSSFCHPLCKCCMFWPGLHLDIVCLVCASQRSLLP